VYTEVPPELVVQFNIPRVRFLSALHIKNIPRGCGTDSHLVSRSSSGGTGSSTKETLRAESGDFWLILQVCGRNSVDRTKSIIVYIATARG
jgi:hypothetical protein